MKILQVSTEDIANRAEKIAWTLHQGYKLKDQTSWLAVSGENLISLIFCEFPMTIGNHGRNFGTTLGKNSTLSLLKTRQFLNYMVLLKQLDNPKHG
jgi:hypothetical protein